WPRRMREQGKSPESGPPLTATLAEQRAMLTGLLEHVDDRVYFKDRNSRFISISRSLAEQFGLDDPAEAEGKSDFDFFNTDHAEQAFEDEQEIMRSGVPLRGKIERETWTQGRVSWGLTNKVPLFDADGKIIGTCG